ncbi:MAG: response regulator transcription factor [Candidatus Thermoplasmatota archaeon]|nr:response regulator transcription factor [Candidatus Thermoplasmatota archaeon]
MKILLVEDDRWVSPFIKKGLQEKGYVVDAAFDGEEGFHLALSQTYDLIILDILLPEMNGYEVLKNIREKEVLTPVICLTAKDEKEDIVQGLELGADDYLVKPFSFTELLARIKAVLRRGKKDAEQSKLNVGDLTLDLMNRTAYRNETKIELSNREFLLLEYLMRNAEQILTRTMILENVWGYNFDPSSNIIDVHVNHLRTKIDKDFPQKLIHTIKGAGYVLKSE